MAYLEYLASDFRQWSTSAADPGPAPRIGAGDSAPRLVRAVQTVLMEIEQAQVFVATSASIATVMLDVDAGGIGPWHIQTYGPAEPEIYPGSGHDLNAGLDVAQLLPIVTYYGRLGFAQRLSQAALRLDARLPHDQRRSEFEKLEDAWRHVCSASLAASQATRNWLDLEGQPLAPVVNAKAEFLLKSAERGERPCVDRHGNITVPGWAECREAKRVPVKRPATAQYRGVKQTVIIDNASASGLGLLGLIEAIPGRMIAVILENGETLTGAIVWAKGERTGIALDQPLADDHELLAGTHRC